MRVATGLGSLGLLLIAAHAVRADRIYFSTSSSSYSSSFGSSTHSSFTLSNAPQTCHRPQVGQSQHVVHVNRPSTVIITAQRPTTVIIQGGRPRVTVGGCSPVIVQGGQCCQHRPQVTWYRRPMVGYSGGWSHSRPSADCYPGFPSSHSVSTWSRHVAPSSMPMARTWGNAPTLQNSRRGWTLLGR